MLIEGEKNDWRFGLIDGGIGAVMVGTASFLVFGWIGMVAGELPGLIVGWVAFAVMYLTTSIFQ